MSFVQRENDRLRAELSRQDGDNDISHRLHAASCALLWSQEPLGRRAPIEDILDLPPPTQQGSGHSLTDSATSPLAATG
jgi:hypothetical protein